MMTIVAVAAYVATQGAASANIASNGHFRDGIHLGTLDPSKGKMPHLARGPTNPRQSWKGRRTLKQPHFSQLSALKKSAGNKGFGLIAGKARLRYRPALTILSLFR